MGISNSLVAMLTSVSIIAALYLLAHVAVGVVLNGESLSDLLAYLIVGILRASILAASLLELQSRLPIVRSKLLRGSAAAMAGLGLVAVVHDVMLLGIAYLALVEIAGFRSLIMIVVSAVPPLLFPLSVEGCGRFAKQLARSAN
jgi:hypothetical protein